MFALIVFLKQDKERKTWVQFIHKENSLSLKQVLEYNVFLNAEGAWNFPSIKEFLKKQSSSILSFKTII